MSTGYDGHITLKTKVDTSGISKGFGSLKSVASSTAKTLLAVGAAAATATVTITKMSVSAYADYEQLVGGVETLFKQSSDKVLSYANQAFMTAGMSANEYMKSVTSFSASLLNSLGGDTEKAADVANMALIDMSDNANKMGTEMELIQNAYQGFAKQNYTMLDNLKLGYGGTKTEMERLLKDAQKITGIKYDINNLSDVYNAIHAIQENLGIAGTTAKEAEHTISGSASMVKASWENVLTAIAGGGDLDVAINNLVYSIQKYFENIVPVVERALSGIGQMIERVAPLLVQTVAKSLINAIPSLLNAVYQMIVGLAKGIYQGIVEVFKGSTPEALEAQAASIESSVNNQNALTKAVEETEEAQEKALAGFDSLNVLSESNSETSADAETGADFSGLGAEAATTDTGALGVMADEAEGVLDDLMGVIGVSLVAIGVLLLCTGHIAWGIGFIIAGATAVAAKKEKSSGGNATQNAVDTLTVLMGVVGGALVAIGIMLICLGSVGLGIGLIIAGAATVGGAAVAIAMFGTGDIEDILNLILSVAAGALLALGLMLLTFSGPSPLSIGLLAAGAAALVGVVALNFGAIVEAIRGPIGVIMAVLGASLIVLGIILLCCGIIPLGIGLLVAGAVSLAAPIAANWDFLTEKVKDACSAIGGFFSDMWNGIKQGFKTGVNFCIDIINGIISGFEWFVNLIVSGINILIDGINKIKIEIPDWLGGGTLGFNIKKIDKVSYSGIPKLAKGAVIPANKEFLAVLGDQKHGRNLEAPEDLIRQIVREESGGKNFNIRATGSMAQLIRLLRLEIQEENTRATIY